MTKMQEKMAVEVAQFGHFQARMLRSFRAAVEDWDEVCSALGAWEAQHLTKDCAEPELEQHHGWVTELLFWGRAVHRATQEPEFPDKVLAARIARRIQHLEDKLALWHRPMSLGEQQRIIQAAFD